MSLVDYSVSDGIAILKMASPPVNSLGRPLCAAIIQAVERAEADAAVVALVIHGAGTFSAGADIKEFASSDALTGPALRGVVDLIESCTKPVCAAIEGVALGGGLELAMSCHFRVAAASAKLGLPEVKLGLLPAYAGTQLLPRLIGENRALEMMLSGDAVDGANALAMGLVNRICEDDADVVDAAAEFAASFTRHSLVPQRAIRRAIAEGARLPLDEALRHERELVREVSASADTLEGVQAFLEKRAPRWRDM